MSQWMSALCAHVGIHAQYRGFNGQETTVSAEVQGAVLRAMGHEPRSEPEAHELLQSLQADEAMRPLPPEVIVDAGTTAKLLLAHAAEWQLEAEGSGGVLAQGKGVGELTLPPLPIGIHALRLRSDAGDFTTWVLARPIRAWHLDDAVPVGRAWGMTTALYALTDGDAVQIGSYDLLGDYAAAIAGHGADFIGINPVHAMGQVRPDDIVSPYSPSHRAFFNTWHCETEPAGSPAPSALVDYPAALSHNASALDRQFTAFQALPGGVQERAVFQAFVDQAGETLHDFALFEVLAHRFGADWRDWPAPYRNRDAERLELFAAENATAIAQVKWAQWQAEAQLAGAQAKALNAGMRIGLYLDLAVGPRLGGAETWAKGSALVTDASLGAPPDMLEPNGQNWGLAPLSPLKCRAQGYAGFAQLLRASMRHAGMIRLDHILGLMRSYWIPEGAQVGTYVSYPLDALLAVVAIESVRNRTVVVGEDLGLVPEGLREKLATSGIYGLDVLQFMRKADGGIVDPADTRELAICTFATHDTPTIAGFFRAEDARARYEFGGITAEIFEHVRTDRARAQAALISADPVIEIHQNLAQANASMVAVQMDDMAAQTTQHNLPGTTDSYPNWQLKAPFTVAEIGQSAAFSQLSLDMAAQGRSNQTGLETQDARQDHSDQTH